MGWIRYYLYCKEWSIYPFVPPLFSLLLALLLNPVYENLLNERLKNFLERKGISNFDLIKVIIENRALQIAYLTEVPAFAVAAITTAQSNYPKLLVGLGIFGIILLITIAAKVFLTDPDYLSETTFPAKGRPRLLARLEWSQRTFYSFILILLNVCFITIIIITLPKRSVPMCP